METPSADSKATLDVFQSGDYKTAIPLLQADCSKDKSNPALQAALLSSLVYEGHVDDAADLSSELADQFPDSAEVLAARAEFHYYMGNMGEAEKLDRQALKVKPDTARAYYGLYRIFRAASLFHSARLACLRAHELAPDDDLITSAFLRYANPSVWKEKYSSFIQTHPWFYENYERYAETTSEVSQEMAEHKAYELEGNPQPVTLRLISLAAGANYLRGLGLELRIENGRALRLLLDTGVSGILVGQRAVDKAGLNHLGATEHWGVGDKGTRKGFVAVADSCKIGALAYKTCVFEALEGKGRIAGDEDGLIGADFFSSYLIHIDFQRHEMKLTPLPKREPNPQGYDRTFPPGEESFTPVWRVGNHLFVATTVNRKSSGLFLLDTGSSLTNIDSTFARLSTKLHGNEYVRVRGISGQVKDVFEADKAELAFGHFRQPNIGMTAFNLNNAPRHQEIRMSGIMGMPLLAMFRLDLDYRNGLVNFDYALR